MARNSDLKFSRFTAMGVTTAAVEVPLAVDAVGALSVTGAFHAAAPALTGGATPRSLAYYLTGQAAPLLVRSLVISAPSSNTATISLGTATAATDLLTAGGDAWGVNVAGVAVDLNTIYVWEPTGTITNVVTIRYIS